MKVRVNAVAIANLLLGIQDSCHTCHELAELTGHTIGTVRYWLKVFHAKKIIHICDWREDARGSRVLKVYTLGTGEDMPKPKPKGSKAACARYRAKQKQMKLMNILSAPRNLTTNQGLKTYEQQTSA